jgi:hypothetical protein
MAQRLEIKSTDKNEPPRQEDSKKAVYEGMPLCLGILVVILYGPTDL